MVWLISGRSVARFPPSLQKGRQIQARFPPHLLCLPSSHSSHIQFPSHSHNILFSILFPSVPNHPTILFLSIFLILLTTCSFSLHSPPHPSTLSTRNCLCSLTSLSYSSQCSAVHNITPASPPKSEGVESSLISHPPSPIPPQIFWRG